MALVVAKSAGRPFDVYGGEAVVRAEGDANFEMEVARALETQQFQLHLQPQVELPSRRVVGAEALLLGARRWPGGYAAWKSCVVERSA
jgi:sensor c-di-GMP phosphodiesterase-like protein